MSYMEYKEFRIPADMQSKIDSISSEDRGMTEVISEAGVFDWINKLSREEGWRPVWQTFQIPFLVMEREIIEEVKD